MSTGCSQPVLGRTAACPTCEDMTAPNGAQPDMAAIDLKRSED